MVRKSAVQRVLLGGIVLFIVGLAIAKLWVFQLVSVQGDDMAPALQQADWLLTYRLNRTPSRGAVVLMQRPDTGALLLRRVVGLPGETVALRNETLVINGQAWRREIRGPVRLRAAGGSAERTALLVAEHRPDGHHLLLKDPSRRSKDVDTTRLTQSYYVMSDDRNHGVDSRDFGPVPAEAVHGVVVLRLTAGPGSLTPQGVRGNWERVE